MTPVPTLDREKPPVSLAAVGGSLLLNCDLPPNWTVSLCLIIA